MADCDSEFFFKHFMDSDGEDSDGDTELLVSAALWYRQHNKIRRPIRRGSIRGRAYALARNRQAGHLFLFNDYFHRTNPVFSAQLFRRQYRMGRPLFKHIMQGVAGYNDYFICKPDACGRIGFSSYQKCTAAIRMLSYGVAGDSLNEYLRMCESTCLESMYRFCTAVVQIFGSQYLRAPTAADTAHLLSVNESRGFPRMLGSIDCMHWEWKNCPFGWQGAYKGHAGGCTVILEAVASQDPWIWHSFFGTAGSHNDINVLQCSLVFSKLAEGQAPVVNYEINGLQYNKEYYLADGHLS
ncbi:uncharacterized protein LOC100831363 [Brachypodium distachyon]|uniref:uncharacterized protein LOC100831363 n=1 Tax=Brachypodium distachyon TaxID=15368 RepID=UPI00052FF5E0|nr:uncharacterized protein LOC100831363 [Brachypodium distachyon]|eukprot:XP_010238911.1 uncharacterized protein LOC100831363 [Brachypodium distachyon]